MIAQFSSRMIATAALLTSAALIPRAEAAARLPGRVSTVAGFGIMDRSNTDINLATPGLLDVDDSGWMYFADAGNHAVFRRDPWNALDRLAGDGLPGFSGDGGLAINARFNSPHGVAAVRNGFNVNPDGRLYIADTGNHRIRVVQKNARSEEIISTFAGDGSVGYKGDGGPAEQAGFVSPEALFVDATGVLYIADRLDHRVRKVTTDGKISTVAGSGEAGFSGDGGLATSARLNEPSAVFVDSKGALYISDRLNDRIRIVTSAGKIDTFIGGGMHLDDGGGPTETAIHRPAGIGSNDKGFFFADGPRIRGLVDGKIRTITGSVDEGWTGDLDVPSKARFRHPIGIALAIYEFLFVSDDGQRRIRKVTGTEERDYVDTPIGGNVYDDTEGIGAKVTWPVALSARPDGRVLIADYGNRRIRSLEPPHSKRKPREPYFLYTLVGEGEMPAAVGAKAVDVAPAPPTGVASGPGEAYYFSEGDKGRVWKVDATGLMASVEIPGLLHPEGLALTSEGRLFVADRDARKIWAVDSSGAVSVFAGSGDGPFAEGAAATSAGLKAPEALALGPDGSVYISDSGDHRVSRVTPDGIIHTVAGTGEVGLAEKGKAISARLAGPEGVAVDSDGTVYISDSMNHRLVRVDKNGDLEPVSGGPDPGLPLRDPLYLKDIEEWAGAAKYYEPAGLAFDGQGNLYIADRRNHRIRVIANVAAARFGPEPASAPGDVNGDGKVDVKDVVLTLQVAVKSAVFTDLQAAAADVAPHPGASGRPYGDGKVDVSDAARLLRRVLGFIPTEWP